MCRLPFTYLPLDLRSRSLAAQSHSTTSQPIHFSRIKEEPINEMRNSIFKPFGDDIECSVENRPSTVLNKLVLSTLFICFVGNLNSLYMSD